MDNDPTQCAAGAAVGRVCWIDLAAADLGSASKFYRALFGWQATARSANGGGFTELRNLGDAFGSIYQLSAERMQAGTPSHWLPYVRVADVDAVVAKALALGGELLVQPFDVEGMARIAVILDAVGAQLGVWQALDGGPYDA
ncbi:hypothetical protein SAMN06265795_13113 [Noviherbaspirillum humi]|uniref:VOC domain-containing protein n=1 Tax=Noviherbaspirillum humi TaxID=1688639 RepID=A0A239M4D3_9BURK|nr:VOC family protein [Noviherbaspirillum humi]SNT37450.1 hypothetical protein SAMN06265795_13113 [Noviherbaspirillum humi]